jgi:hypothetical protein
MAHKFKKKSYAHQGLPGSLPDSLWSKLKKSAHSVWDMTSHGDQISAVRKTQDTAIASEAVARHDINQDEITPGDLVLLFLGGRSISARVVEVTTNGLSLISREGLLENIPSEWVKKSQ